MRICSFLQERLGSRLSRNISLLLGRLGSFSRRAEPPDERCIVTSSPHPAVCTVGVGTPREKQAAREGPVGWRQAAG